MKKLIILSTLLLGLTTSAFAAGYNGGYSNGATASNATTLESGTWEIPGAIGSTTPNSISATTGAYSGAVSSTKGCITNYVRLNSNYCISNDSTHGQATVDPAGTCVNLDAFYFLASPSLSIDILVELDLISGSAAGVETTTVSFYSDSSCTTRLSGVGVNGFVPRLTSYSGLTGAGTTFSKIIIPIQLYTNSISHIYAKRTDTTLVTGGSAAAYLDQIYGYSD